MTAAGKLGAALIVLLRRTVPPPSPAPMREASAPAPSTAVVTVWDKSIHEALYAPEAKVSIHIGAPKIETVKARNVVGLLRGADPALKDTYVIVTGHYDHLGVRPGGDGDRIFNGA